jgi:hypothetical protein
MSRGLQIARLLITLSPHLYPVVALNSPFQMINVCQLRDKPSVNAIPWIAPRVTFGKVHQKAINHLFAKASS